LLKVADFDPPHLHLAPPQGVISVEFRGHLWRQKIRVPGLSCGVVCVIVRLAVLVEHRLVADRRTQGHSIYSASSSSSSSSSFYLPNNTTVCTIAHLREYDSRRAGQQGLIRTLTAALASRGKNVISVIRQLCYADARRKLGTERLLNIFHSIYLISSYF